MDLGHGGMGRIKRVIIQSAGGERGTRQRYHSKHVQYTALTMSNKGVIHATSFSDIGGEGSGSGATIWSLLILTTR